MRIIGTSNVMRLSGIVLSILVIGSVSLIRATTVSAIQYETHEEKATNLKKQATGGLFQKWTFDQEPLNAVPRGFVKGVSNDEPLADWIVQAHATAPSPPNVVGSTSNCAQLCYQVLLADGLEYEYPDLSVRFQVPKGLVGSGGIVLGVRDPKNFYAAVVDPVVPSVQFVRVSGGHGTSLAQAPVSLKPVDWHSLRVQRNTIISKDFIEVFVDGVLVLSIEDQALGLGQVGLVTVGKSTLLFDSFHAVPLFSHRPLSAPPAY